MKPSYDESFWEDERERLVDFSIAESLKPGGEYYPFSRDNFGEALGNLNQTRMMTLAGLTAHADEKYYDKAESASVGECLRAAVWDYWKDIATEHFEDQTPSAREIFEDDLDDTRGER